MDVASVLQPPNKRVYMMLSITYGMMSNLDIDTEPLRWMGDIRFTVGVLRVSVWQHAYPKLAMVCVVEKSSAAVIIIEHMMHLCPFYCSENWII